MKANWKRYYQTMAAELGSELAASFIESLQKQSGGCEKVASDFFYALGRAWAPLVKHWGSWVEKNAQGPIALILRDARPLDVLPLSKAWRRLYLNRLTCGIGDELSGAVASTCDPLLKEYLRQHDCAEPFTFVDSGCYGTVVQELHRLGIHFKPLFFFSKNPNIPGFLNELGVSLADGEILNDSLECGFPHAWQRPSVLVSSNGAIAPLLQSSDELSVRFGMEALRGLCEASPEVLTPLQSAERILKMSAKARAGTFTGVMGHASPQWSGKEAFLANWPKELCWV